MTGPQSEPVSLQYITDTLQNHEPFYFWVNDGNLGDYIIAEATLQLFCRAKLQWQPYDPNNPPQEKKYVLVYGGGGRFVSYWQGIERIQKHLTKPEVKHCIILPHSLHDVDSFVKALDERHIVFCRERKTLTYCQSINNQSKFILAHDIGLSLDLDKLTPLHALDNLVITNECTETAAQFKLLTSKSAKKIRKKAQKAIVIAPGNKKKIAFFLRNDAEKSTTLFSPWSFDLSGIWSGSCTRTPVSGSLLIFMAELVEKADIIVTDRLHVAIMAILLNKEVYMLDNSYGKLSEVYKVSLKDKTNVHLLPDFNLWPKELICAWNKLNSGWRTFKLRIRTIRKQLRHRLKQCFLK